MDGILLVDKPKDWTSFDVVAKIRGIIQRATGQKVKVGHTGTLDPLATGLLVLCIGKYTKKVPELIKHDKSYIAEITFGAFSTTGDSEGELKQIKTIKFSEEELKTVLAKFIGEQQQTPPSYSAVKVNGKRAYQLAREGKEVNIKPRIISIHRISLISYKWPVAKVECRVGSGTYIRVLAEDIAKDLNTGAYLSNLRRTEIDNLSVEDAISLESINIDILRDNLLA